MSDYLIHFNKNHNPKTGRFDYGDGDGDGVNNDHANGNKRSSVGDAISRVADNIRYNQYQREMRKAQKEYEEETKRYEARRKQKGALRTAAVVTGLLGLPVTTVALATSSLGSSADNGKKWVRQMATGRYSAASKTFGNAIVEEFYEHPETVAAVNEFFYKVGG